MWPCIHCNRTYHEAWCPIVNLMVMEAWRFVKGSLTPEDTKFMFELKIRG